MPPLGARCTREIAAKIGAIPVLELPAWVHATKRYDATRMDFIELRVDGNRSFAWPIDDALLRELRATAGSVVCRSRHSSEASLRSVSVERTGGAFMGAIVAIAGGKAKRGVPEPGPSSPRPGAIVECFQNLFRENARKILAGVLELSLGAAKKKLSGERRLSAEEASLLLRTEHGIHFLAGVMGEARPAWYRGFLAHVAAGNARRALRRQEQELREAINAVENLNGAVVRADAALAFQDEDFMRPHVDGLRYAHRVANSPLAPSKGAKR